MLLPWPRPLIDAASIALSSVERRGSYPLKRLDHAEENVVPFYKHLEAKLQALQDEIARG